MKLATNETTTLLDKESQADNLVGLFDQPTDNRNDLSYNDENSEADLSAYLVPIEADEPPKSMISTVISTILGALTFSLYHIVFCLASAATIERPHANHSSMGAIAKTATLGILAGGPTFVYFLPNVPAIYPTTDLFLAPFLAHAAYEIDSVLYKYGLENDDTIFLTTFTALVVAGFLISGSLCVLAARVKLANFGSFLPYSVLCGFFTTIGLLIWSLGFSVDTGMKIQELFRTNDLRVWTTALLHHAPSLVVGIIMHFLGPKNPFSVILLLMSTVAGSFVVMSMTGTTLERAQDLKWFYTVNELLPTESKSFAFEPPLPFGVIYSTIQGNVHIEAFLEGVPIIAALVFLYVIRSSLHAAALRKNIPNVSKPEDLRKGKTPSITEIYERGYGYSQIAASLIGGFPVSPSVAAALTMFKLGAASAAPQYISCLMVIVFYLNNFRLVQYIPKPAFSCLMVLAGLDLIKTWLIGSYKRTKSKSEWIVVPVLAILAFVVGILYAICIGIVLSTFIFVGNFYRAGTVKFVGSSLFLHSTVERGVRETEWLRQNGDYIQILVLQNYLFFGNIQSVVIYVSTMFESVPKTSLQAYVPPIPKFVVIDLALVTGMDGSAVDAFIEMLNICRTNRAKLFLCGLKPSIRGMLAYAGVKPKRGDRDFLFYSDLELALAKAEDRLVSEMYDLEELDRIESKRRQRKGNQSRVEDGFLYALEKIDEIHGLEFKGKLERLRGFVKVIELEPDEVLSRGEGENGLYFVEFGLIRVRSSSDHGKGTLRGSINRNGTQYQDPTQSLGHMNARGTVAAREQADMKHTMVAKSHQQTFRLARIGQGWVIGSIEATNGMQRPGIYVALSQCRLHHLPKSVLYEIESKFPDTAMHLYKLLAHLSTKRQEVTIQQLGQFVHILNSPTPHLHGKGKIGLGRLHFSAVP